MLTFQLTQFMLITLDLTLPAIKQQCSQHTQPRHFVHRTRTHCFDDASCAWLTFPFLTETLSCIVFPYVPLTSLLYHMLIY